MLLRFGLFTSIGLVSVALYSLSGKTGRSLGHFQLLLMIEFLVGYSFTSSSPLCLARSAGEFVVLRGRSCICALS